MSAMFGQEPIGEGEISTEPENISERIKKLDADDLNPNDRKQVADYTSEANKFVVEQLKTTPDYIKEENSKDCVTIAVGNIAFLFNNINSGELISNVPDENKKQIAEIYQKIDEVLELDNKSKANYLSGAYALKDYLWKQLMSTDSTVAKSLAEILISANKVINDVLYNPTSEVDSKVTNEIAINTTSMVRREQNQVAKQGIEITNFSTHH